jgi:hypothetical protein
MGTYAANLFNGCECSDTAEGPLQRPGPPGYGPGMHSILYSPLDSP